MQREKRCSDNPVAYLEPLNVQTDRRHDRRAFTLEELKKILAVARQGPERLGLAGPERALRYHLAAETGLRSSELRSLTRASFRLDGPCPTVTVLAGYSKRRREDVLPLRPELAKDLKAFLALKTPQAPVFTMPTRQHMIEVFRSDLAAAEIPYRDGSGRVGDFHALRHTFITNLARGGVSPKLALRRDINLTMTRYSHTLLEEQAVALDALPDLSQPLKATGTQGPPGSFKVPGQGGVAPGR
jgi:integrase